MSELLKRVMQRVPHFNGIPSPLQRKQQSLRISVIALEIAEENFEIAKEKVEKEKREILELKEDIKKLKDE